MSDQPSQDPPTTTGEGTKKRLVRSVIIASVLGALVFATLAFVSDARQVGNYLGRFATSHFVAALALVTCNYALRFARWQHYLRVVGVRVPTRTSLLVFLSGFSMSITPGKLGEVFKSVLLAEAEGVSIERTAPIVLSERLTDLLALVIIAAIGAMTFPGGWLVTLVGGVAAGVAVLAASVRPVGLWFVGIAVKLPGLRNARPKLEIAYESLHATSAPRALGIATLLATVGWALEAVATWWIVRGFPGASIEPVAAAFAYAASQIAGALAFVPGGLGVTEAGMAGLLKTLGGSGVPTAVAAGSVMLVRLATLWWAVLLGVLALGVFRMQPMNAATSRK